MPTRAVYLLPLVAALFWGYGFLPTVWALESVGPWWLLTYRFLICSAAYLLIVLFTKNWPTKEEWKWGFLIGLAFVGIMGLQTVGLQTTSVTNSGFLTVLYVVFTPILGVLFFKIRTFRTDWLMAFVALFGAYLLSGANLSQITKGDLWTIGGAMFGALHLLIVAKSPSHLRPHHLNAIQSVFGMLVCGAISLLSGETQSFILPAKAFVSILILGLLVSLIGFSLQFIAQKHIAPGPVAIMFLLESPIAAFFALSILGDTLSSTQIAGAAVIFLSSLTATIIHLKRRVTLDTEPVPG